MPFTGLVTSSQPQQHAPGPRASGAILLCGARSHRANQGTQDTRAPRHGASTHRGTEPRRNRPQSAPDAARLDQPPPRSPAPARQRPGRRPSDIYLGHLSVGAVFSANPKTRYDAHANYSKNFFGPFFQRSQKVAMMRARTTQKFSGAVFSAGREFRYDARASYSGGFSSSSGNPS